jgi:hypothetical protein
MFSLDLDGLDLHTSLFSLRQIKSATGDFDPKNKIGEGGFGPVYKVTLPTLFVFVKHDFFLWIKTFLWL